MPSLDCRQRGAVAVEFALVFIVFMAMAVAIMEFSRVMYVYASAVEATRLGARIATVCGTGDVAKVKARMRGMLSSLTPDKISITYPATECSAATCDPVTVRIQGLTVVTSIPMVTPLSFPVPAFSTSIPGESLSSTNNALCN
ncbi:MAG: pilus assembly protein [Zoogloea sp.]|nr:MAG: pilus assembly protein [Zoogloea sp.]